MNDSLWTGRLEADLIDGREAVDSLAPSRKPPLKIGSRALPDE